MANDQRKLLSACKSWRRKASRSIARHGVEATIARLGETLPAPSVAAGWGDSVLARRVGVLAFDECGDYTHLAALTQWAVLRELGYPAELVSESGRYVVELGGASVSPKRMTFRPPSPVVEAAIEPAEAVDHAELAEPAEVRDEVAGRFVLADTVLLDDALEWLDDVVEYRAV